MDDAAVRANAALARQHLGPALPIDAPPLRVTVDDGWQQAWGEWQPNAKFPDGLSGLAADLRGDGFTMGVWFAPLLVDADAPLAAAHPDWFVQGAIYPHLEHGPMRVLDVTNPEAAAHLDETVRRIVGWGYDFLKIDFLFAAFVPGERAEASTALFAYRRALQIIREAAGEDVVILAVGAPPTPSLPFVDAWRVGGDIIVEPFGPSFPFVTNELRSVAARWPFCRVTLCDPDPPVLRAFSEDEVQSSAFVAATAGGAWFLSDDLRALDEARAAWGAEPTRVAAALSGRPATPEDWFPDPAPTGLVSALADHLAGTHRQVAPVRWRGQDGRRWAVNATAAPIEVEGVTVPAHAVRGLP